MEAYFNVHFFKEKSREIDVRHLISFFETIEGIEIKINDNECVFHYSMPRLGYFAKFIVTRKSTVPDIFRLNPKYLDLNFHLEFPVLTPDYVAKKLFEIVKDITNRFGYFIYNKFFEDVRPFKMELLFKVFEMVKNDFVSRYPSLLKSYHLVSKRKLSDVLRYVDEIYSLQIYYRDLDTYVPRYLFLEEKETSKVFFAIEWKYSTLTVFPPHTDYLFYRENDKMRVLKYQDILSLISVNLDDVPGFIMNTKVIPLKKLKKINKLIKKGKFNGETLNYSHISLESLID